MPNVILSGNSRGASLDKLALLSPSPFKIGPGPGSGPDLDALKKRAKAKWFTQSYLQHLINLDSPLKNSYINTVFCCHTLHQKDGKITSRYCKNRWCIVCNRIRIGKAINGYLPELRKLEDPQFVTLTIPNVKKSELRGAIAAMVRTWRQMYQCLNKRRVQLRGVRKIECTYNPDEDSYHPHFHLIVSGKAVGEMIICEWLRRFSMAKRKAQDIRPADDGSMVELFKYFTKVITKQKVYVPAMDIIFRSMVGHRVFQPYGISQVSEDVEELQAEVIEGIEPGETFWEWSDCDWRDITSGKTLTGYVPDEKLERLAHNVILE
jgi:hypothetical protein